MQINKAFFKFIDTLFLPQLCTMGNGDFLKKLAVFLPEILDAKKCTIFEVTKIFDVERCKIFYSSTDPNNLKTRKHENLYTHPDIESAVRTQKITIIHDPLINPKTAYFKFLIQANKINEILYIPILAFGEKRSFPNSKITTHVVVLDNGKKFNPWKIKLAKKVSRLISNKIQYDAHLLKWAKESCMSCTEEPL